MYAEVADKIKAVIDGLAAGVGIRTVDFWGKSGLEAVGASSGDLPAVFIMFDRAEPQARLATGRIRSENMPFSIIVAAADWKGVGAAQTGASAILVAIRDAFNPHEETLTTGERIHFTFQGIELIAVDAPILIYSLNIDALQL